MNQADYETRRNRGPPTVALRDGRSPSLDPPAMLTQSHDSQLKEPCCCPKNPIHILVPLLPSELGQTQTPLKVLDSS